MYTFFLIKYKNNHDYYLKFLILLSMNKHGLELSVSINMTAWIIKYTKLELT